MKYLLYIFIVTMVINGFKLYNDYSFIKDSEKELKLREEYSNKCENKIKLITGSRK